MLEEYYVEWIHFMLEENVWRNILVFNECILSSWNQVILWFHYYTFTFPTFTYTDFWWVFYSVQSETKQKFKSPVRVTVTDDSSASDGKFLCDSVAV